MGAISNSTTLCEPSKPHLPPKNPYRGIGEISRIGRQLDGLGIAWRIQLAVC